jgi:NAD+ kinase
VNGGQRAAQSSTQPRPCTWAGRRPRVFLLASGDRRPAILSAIEQLRPEITRLCDVALEDLNMTARLGAAEADFAIVFGGDGSILRAARQMGQRQIPVVGVNFGRLGFLADLLPEDLLPALEQIVAGQGLLTHHLMFHCKILRDGRVIADHLGLNEVAIMSGPPFALQHIELYVDGEFATSYSCDGLIVSTPVGSTAHSLSAGGPIVRKDLRVFVISPLSPHTLTVRPVVESAERVYEIVVRDPNDSTHALVDGQSVGSLTPHDRVRVAQAGPTFQMIQIQGQSYYRTLREKLGWGGAIRNDLR